MTLRKISQRGVIVFIFLCTVELSMSAKAQDVRLLFTPKAVIIARVIQMVRAPGNYGCGDTDFSGRWLLETVRVESGEFPYQQFMTDGMCVSNFNISSHERFIDRYHREVSGWVFREGENVRLAFRRVPPMRQTRSRRARPRMFRYAIQYFVLNFDVH